MMTEKKGGKSRSNTVRSGRKDKGFMNGKRKNFSSRSKNRKVQDSAKRPRRGPRLPNALRKELDVVEPTVDGQYSDGDEDGTDFEDRVVNDVYEYEEGIPEEESKKNRRFDTVENYEYELPEDFEDWKVASDEGEDEDEDYNINGEEDDGKHARMLEEITGLPSDAFEGKKKKDFVISEAYPESEYNPSSDVLDGDGRISIQDLLEPLHGKLGFSKLRKNIHRMAKKSMPTLTPLPKPEQERLERKAAYEQSKKDITKWEPLVKRNREAPTLYFDEDVDVGFSTIGAIASEFEPRTDFEKKIASLLSQNDVVEAYKRDGASLLELNKISMEDVKDRQQRNAKMRSLLFRHELRAKRFKKIKSKSHRRHLKKDRAKAIEAAIQMDPEAAKEHAMKEEFRRAEERMTLKHKNTSKWAKRILQRGFNVQDEATREAFGEQLNQHAALTRKINSVKESSSSDESSDEDDSDDMANASDPDVKLKLLTKAKEKTLGFLQEDDELPKSGVLSLPFMMRGLKKKKEAADEEAKLALEEYETSLRQLEGESESGNCGQDTSSGRMVFGAPKKIINESTEEVKVNNYYRNSDSENDDPKEDDPTKHNQNDKFLRDADIDHNLLREEFGMRGDSVFKSFQETEDAEPKTTYEVSYLASDTWKKMKRPSVATKKAEDNDHIGKSNVTAMEYDQDLKDNDDDFDSDSGGEMVDGILSTVPKSTYELPSRAELIQRAFAGDDVEEEFEKDKDAVLNEENPEPENPVLVPGWGQWTDVQKKKGLPSWMLEEHEMAKKKREESLKKRKDAHLNNVIISEKLDKKAEKLHTKTLPYPYTSKEVFEQSIRMPIGPEFNPVSAIGALNRPEVVKKSGVMIKPIEYEDVHDHEKGQSHKTSSQKQRKGKDKNRSGKRAGAKAQPTFSR